MEVRGAFHGSRKKACKSKVCVLGLPRFGPFLAAESVEQKIGSVENPWKARSRFSALFLLFLFDF
jgi:hypothetical protein